MVLAPDPREVLGGGTYALIYFAFLEHWFALVPDGMRAVQVITDLPGTWAMAEKYLDMQQAEDDLRVVQVD